MKGKRSNIAAILCIMLYQCVNNAPVSAQAREGTAGQFTSELARLRAACMTGDGLRFDIRYTYANENRPSVILDSMAGTFAVQGSNYDIVLDNTETVRNSRYTISLFKEDKAMYVGAVTKENNVNPLAVIDSALSKSGYSKVMMERKGVYKTVILLFPAGGAYKRMSFTIDTVTGLLQKTQYIVKTEMLADPGTKAGTAEKAQYDEYAVVEARFYNYRRGGLGDGMFDEKNYLIKTGADFRPVEKYKDYHIYKATPNL